MIIWWKEIFFFEKKKISQKGKSIALSFPALFPCEKVINAKKVDRNVLLNIQCIQYNDFPLFDEKNPLIFKSNHEGQNIFLKSYLLCLRHVSNDTIGNDEQNEVLWPVSELSCNGSYVVDCWCKIRWSV